MNSGSFESTNLRTFGRFVKKGDTVLNIGAHMGLEAIVYGKIIGESGQLFFFEPYSASYNSLVKNVHLNELEDITSVYKVAASNRS